MVACLRSSLLAGDVEHGVESWRAVRIWCHDRWDRCRNFHNFLYSYLLTLKHPQWLSSSRLRCKRMTLFEPSLRHSPCTRRPRLISRPETASPFSSLAVVTLHSESRLSRNPWSSRARCMGPELMIDDWDWDLQCELERRERTNLMFERNGCRAVSTKAYGKGPDQWFVGHLARFGIRVMSAQIGS